MLYDNNAARLALGCIFQNCQLLNNEKYPLSKASFEGNEWHLRLYQACLYMARHGGHVITAVDLYKIAESDKSVKELFDANNTQDFVEVVKSLAEIDNYEFYWESLRKCELLNTYKKSGFDTAQFENSIDKYRLSEIVDYYDGLIINIKKQFYQDSSTTEIRAGDGFENVKERFKADPLFGATSFSKYLNTAARGWRKGQLTMFGCASGTGKTALGLYNLALVCCPMLWSDEAQDFVANPCYQHESGLVIQYELNGEEELTPKLVASISGVGCYHILNGKYEEGEEARVDKAIEILHDSNIYIVTMPQFTNDKLKACIRDYRLNHNVRYVVFDYVSQQATVSSDIAKKNGVATRSDQVLADIVSNLKDIAIENDVAILTFCQTNAAVNSQEILDAGCMAGSRAMQDKLDVGGIIMPLRKTEKEVADMIFEAKGNKYGVHCNRVCHLFKVRFGSGIQNLKIWFNIDLNTGRVHDMWVTDSDNKPLDSYNKTALIYRE